jgi:hypothetical protein
VAGEYGCADHIQNRFGFSSLQLKTRQRRRKLGGDIGERIIRPRARFCIRVAQVQRRARIHARRWFGVPGFEPDVTGCNFVFLRFGFLAGCLAVAEDIVVAPTWRRRSGGESGKR